MSAYSLTQHAQERIAQRRIRERWLAAALCQPPTYSLTKRTAQYFDPATGTVLVVDTTSQRVVTVYLAGEG